MNRIRNQIGGTVKGEQFGDQVREVRSTCLS